MAHDATVTRYHPLLVTLHWVAGSLVADNLAAGLLILSGTSNADPAKAELLRFHMLSGLTILVLMAVRLVVRFATAKPPMPHSNPALRRFATATHWLLYIAVIGMLVSGLGMAQLGNLFPLLEGRGVALPETFESLPPHAGHALTATALLVLLALHLAGVVYPQVKGEKPLARMWFGSRRAV